VFDDDKLTVHDIEPVLVLQRGTDCSDFGRPPAPSFLRLLIAEAALRLSRWLIAAAERCQRWPRVGLAMLFVYKHVAAVARRVLPSR